MNADLQNAYNALVENQIENYVKNTAVLLNKELLLTLHRTGEKDALEKILKQQQSFLEACRNALNIESAQ